MIFGTGNKNLATYICIILIAGVCSGCNDEKNFEMGEDLVDIKSNLALIDTFTLQMSTVKTDSIQTSGYSKILVGQYTDGNFGTISAKGYMQLTPESYQYTMGTECKYDSINLFMHFTGYAHGDTTKNNSIEVYQILESLNKNSNNDYWYNYESIDYSPELLGQKTYRPKPKRKDYLSVKLSDSFGQAMFDSIYNNSKVFYTEENFVKFFKGIAITPGSENSSVVQFDTMYVTLYYHEGTDSRAFNFNYAMSNYYNYHYTQILHDYSNSPFAMLTNQKIKLATEDAGNLSYCQAGTGVMTRIDIPTLVDLKQSATYLKIMKAELIIRPLRNSYKSMELPDDLSLYFVNDNNKKVEVLTAATGYALQPELYIDDIFGDETSYTFDITEYINYFYNQTTDDNTPSFLLSIPDDDFPTSLKRIIIGDSKHPTNTSKLKIYYWYMNEKQ